GTVGGKDAAVEPTWRYSRRVLPERATPSVGTAHRQSSAKKSNEIAKPRSDWNGTFSNQPADVHPGSAGICHAYQLLTL
ncbi:MAG: hypothetical protein L0H73_14845, partial [Nitrococcus sp.]|nr:hypothetical protein [Nitrococcus sp.]